MSIEDKIKLALTFDDVLLKPQYSNVLPKQVDLSVKLSNKINRQNPYCNKSAP